MRALGATGCASPENVAALNDLSRHPQNPLPDVVDSEAVLFALKSFPRGSSPGGSCLQAQHLLDATAGSTTPAAIECLGELTYWMNMLLAGREDPRVAPWLVGAPLLALQKKMEHFVLL